MKRLAQTLRRLADHLDKPAVPITGHVTISTSTGGVVIESEGTNPWHPDQHGNVIEVEPDIIRKARRDGTLSDM